MRTKVKFSKILRLVLLFIFGISVSWAATITVELRDSDGNLLTDGNTAELSYGHIGNWNQAVNIGNGTWTIETEESILTYRMMYKHGCKDKTFSTSNTNVLFSTVSVTPEVKDSDGNILQGGRFIYRCIVPGSPWSDDHYTGVLHELLEGEYIFDMHYNYSSKMQTFLISGPSTNVEFITVSTTVYLKDSNGNNVDGGMTHHYNHGWSPHYSPNVTIQELLPGTFTFSMQYNSAHVGKQVEISGASQDVVFETTTVLVSIKDSDGNFLAGGSARNLGSFGSWNTAYPTNMTIELLPGIYDFFVSFHHDYARLFDINISGSYTEVPLVTVTTMILFEDCDGNTASGGAFDHLGDNCGMGFCNCHEAGISTEILPGNHKFRFRLNGSIVGEEMLTVSGTDYTYVFEVPGIAEIFVWNDLDENGIQNIGEPGIAGIQVDLEEPNGTWLMTAITNAAGKASFIDYPWDIPVKMHVYVPGNMEPTKSSGPKTNNLNSDIDKNGLTAAFSGGSCASFIDWIGAGLVYTTSAKTTSISQRFNLYPNPTKSSTILTYELEKDAEISVIVYDMIGREVAIIDEGVKTAGKHELHWYADKLEPGTYICRFTMGKEAEIMRMIVTE